VEHGLADGHPGRVVDTGLVAVRQIHQPQHFRQIVADLVEPVLGGADLGGIHAEVRADAMAEQESTHDIQVVRALATSRKWATVYRTSLVCSM